MKVCITVQLTTLREVTTLTSMSKLWVSLQLPLRSDYIVKESE